MRVNAINCNSLNFCKSQKFNRLDAKKQMRATEKLVDKGISELYSDFDKYRGIPFDKTIYYSDVTFNVPDKKDTFATIAIQPMEKAPAKQGQVVVEVQNDKSGEIVVSPVISGGKDSIVSFLNDNENSIPNITRTILGIANKI